MPRVQININAQPYTICSSNRDTIAAWLAEIIGYMPGNQADWVEFQIFPMSVPATPDNPRGLDWPQIPTYKSYELSLKGVERFAADMRELLKGTGQ